MKRLIKEYKKIGIFVLMVFSFFLGYIISSNPSSHSTVEEGQPITVVSNQKVGTEMKIQQLDEQNHYAINVYYPFSAYNDLNKILSQKMQEYVDEFHKIRDNTLTEDTRLYTLDITYDTYLDQDTISYVFHIMSNTGGAHPDTTLWTIVYDKKTNKTITMDSLIEKYPNLLNQLSKISRELLVKNNKDLSLTSSMLIEGTTPSKENFSYFVFSKQGLVVFFPRYQIAPYYLGEFHVVIPYHEIFKK